MVPPTGALVVSLDFELHWGVWREVPVAAWRERLEGARRAVPALLELFAELGVRATWATVGLLMCEGRDEAIARMPRRLPAYPVPEDSPYRFLRGLGRGERDAPYHFAPSLVRAIRDAPGQELGTHTFAHFPCLEPGHDPAAFRADLEAAQAAAAGLGLRLRSLVFPRNQVSAPHLAACRGLGLVAYRGPRGSGAWRPRSAREQTLAARAIRLLDAYLPVTRPGRPAAPGSAIAPDDVPADVPATRFLRPVAARAPGLARLHVARIHGELARAAARGDTYHLWAHPHGFGLATRENLAMLREVIVRALELGLRPLGMAEAAREARVRTSRDRPS